MAERVKIPGWLSARGIDAVVREGARVRVSVDLRGIRDAGTGSDGRGNSVACSDIPALREVGGDAVLFFDPLDEDAMAAALDRITSDEELRRKLAEAGTERARPYTWIRTAEMTLAALAP